MVLGYLWIGICALSCVLMLIIKKKIFIASALSCVAPFVLDLTVENIVWQFVSFIASFIVIVLLFTLFLPSGVSEKAFTIDSLIGQRCVVEEEINNNAGRGQVRVNDTSWSARSISDEEIYKVGETLKIVAVEGVKLICKN